MTKKEIAAKRDKFLITIREFEKQKYDARPLLPEFYKLTEQFKQAGGRPAPLSRGLTMEYWDDPETRCNDYLNQWPIVFVGDGTYRREYRKQPTCTPVFVEIKKKEEPNPNVSNYYRINITWDDDLDDTNIKHFFGDLCLKQEQQVDSHKLSYIYEGNDESFKILKRATLSLINILYPSLKDVAVYGKQIKS